MSAEAQALLFTAARAQLVRDVIRPALAAEKIVVEDLVAEGFPRELIQRVAHERLRGFDYRAQRLTDPQFGVMEVRRIEVVGPGRTPPASRGI